MLIRTSVMCRKGTPILPMRPIAMLR